MLGRYVKWKCRECELSNLIAIQQVNKQINEHFNAIAEFRIWVKYESS